MWSRGRKREKCSRFWLFSWVFLVLIFFLNCCLFYLIFLFSTSNFYEKLWVVTVPFRFEYKKNKPDGKEITCAKINIFFSWLRKCFYKCKVLGTEKWLKGHLQISSVKMDLICTANVGSKIGGLWKPSTGLLLYFSYLHILECFFCDLFDNTWLESHGIYSLGVIIYVYVILKLMTFVFGIVSAISDLLNFAGFGLRCAFKVYGTLF